MGPPGGGRGRQSGKFQSEPNSYFYDLNAKLTFKPTPKDVLFLSFFNGKDDLDNSRTMEAPPFMADQNIIFNSDIQDVTSWGNLALGLNWHRQWNDAISTHAVLSYTNFSNTRDNSPHGMGDLLCCASPFVSVFIRFRSWRAPMINCREKSPQNTRNTRKKQKQISREDTRRDAKKKQVINRMVPGHLKELEIHFPLCYTG